MFTWMWYSYIILKELQYYHYAYLNVSIVYQNTHRFQLYRRGICSDYFYV